MFIIFYIIKCILIIENLENITESILILLIIPHPGEI